LKEKVTICAQEQEQLDRVVSKAGKKGIPLTKGASYAPFREYEPDDLTIHVQSSFHPFHKIDSKGNQERNSMAHKHWSYLHCLAPFAQLGLKVEKEASRGDDIFYIYAPPDILAQH
jgi:hypothetical protein